MLPQVHKARAQKRAFKRAQFTDPRHLRHDFPPHRRLRDFSDLAITLISSKQRFKFQILKKVTRKPGDSDCESVGTCNCQVWQGARSYYL